MSRPPSENASGPRRPRLVSFDYFRGIAILMIVAGHSYGPWRIDTFGERMIGNLLTGGAILFVFISGFFFHHVFAPGFAFRAFMLKKSRNVLLPYALLSVTAILGYVLSASPLPYANALGVTSGPSTRASVAMIATYLWTGRIATAYWYVPFIAIMFAMSPLFLRYLRMATTVRLATVLVLVLVSMFVQRPGSDLAPLHAVLYFMPAYLLGMNCSLHRRAVVASATGRAFAIGCGVLALAVVQTLVIADHGNRHKDTLLSWNGLDLMIVQKLVMCLFFVALLQNHEDRDIPWLRTLAAWSFAIYFIHPWVLKLLWGTGFIPFLSFVPGMGVFVLTVPSVVAASVLIAWLVKRVLGEGSRFVMGA